MKQVVPKISSSVPMVNAFQQNGSVMGMKIVKMEKTRKTVSQVNENRKSKLQAILNLIQFKPICFVQKTLAQTHIILTFKDQLKYL